MRKKSVVLLFLLSFNVGYLIVKKSSDVKKAEAFERNECDHECIEQLEAPLTLGKKSKWDIEVDRLTKKFEKENQK